MLDGCSPKRGRALVDGAGSWGLFFVFMRGKTGDGRQSAEKVFMVSTE